MTSSFRADCVRLLSIRSTWVYFLLLIGLFVSPVILVVLVLGGDATRPLQANDLVTCADLFHVIAIIFSGATVATEIRHGALTVNFLTQRGRWRSMVSGCLIGASFVTLTYSIGVLLALVIGEFYPKGVEIDTRGFQFLVVELLVILVWCLVAGSLAILTRSVAASVAIPLIWILLIENLLAAIPSIQSLASWMPYGAGRKLIENVLGISDGDPTRCVVSLILLGVLCSIPASISYIKHDVPM